MTSIVYPQSRVSTAAMILLCYSLMLQASRVSAIFTMLAAVVRTYSTLTNVVVITHFDNIRAAAGQNARITTRRRLLTNVASIRIRTLEPEFRRGRAPAIHYDTAPPRPAPSALLRYD